MTPGRTATATIVALVLSVCLNVFVAGLIAGRAIRGDAPPSQNIGGGLERFMATVPAEARPVIRQALRDNRSGLQELVAGVRRARQDAASVVAIEPFDRAAFEAALATVRDGSRALEAAVHGIIAVAIDELSPELRAEMAERWGDRS